MDQSIHDLLHMVRTILVIPFVVLGVFMVIAVPAAGLKKILGEVVQEMRDEKRQRTRDRMYRKSVLRDDNDSIREWVWGQQHTKQS